MGASKYQTDKGILIEEHDNDAENPRSIDEGIFSRFYTFSSRYISPDKHSLSSFDSFLDSILTRNDAREIKHLFHSGKQSISDSCGKLVECARKNGYILLPVWRYEHSGVIYKASVGNPFSDDIFDSCLVGVIFCRKRDIHSVLGKRCCKSVIEQINEMMKSEVAVYSEWADGNVYAYNFIYEDGSESGWTCGFYGNIDDNGVKDEFGFSEYQYIGEE